MSCNSCSNVTLPGVAGPVGAAGADGSDGDSVVVLKIYIRASSPPSTPSGGSYDFSTHTLTPPASWSSGVPAGSDPCYVSNGTASVNGTTGTDSSITWSSPVLAFQNGDDGLDGVPVIDVDTSLHPHTTTTPTAVKTTNIPQNTIGTVGDFIKVKGNILTDKVDGYYPTIEVKFDGNTMFFYYIGSFGGNIGDMLGLRFEIDLIVTATNTITPHVRFEAMDDSNVGNKYMYGKISQALDGVIDGYQSSITLDSGTRDITVELTSDNTNTVALTYYEVTKYLKA